MPEGVYTNTLFDLRFFQGLFQSVSNRCLIHRNPFPARVFEKVGGWVIENKVFLDAPHCMPGKHNIAVFLALGFTYMNHLAIQINITN